MPKNTMKLINTQDGTMQCSVCGARHKATPKPGSYYTRSSWRCENGCQLPSARRQRRKQKGEEE